MPKRMVIDGDVYVKKDEYDKEIVEKRVEELAKLDREAFVKYLLKTNDYTFTSIVKEVAIEKINKIGYFDSDILLGAEDDNKELQKRLAIIILGLQN